MTTEFLWNSPGILIRILEFEHIILVKFFQDLIRVLQALDDHGILMKFFKNFDQNSVGQPLYPTIQMTIKFFKSRWPQNSYEILEGFWSEFWLLAIVSNNSDDYEILQELDDHGILVKFFQDLRNSCEILSGFWSELFSRIRWPRNSYEIFSRILINIPIRKLDDHGILVNVFWSELF
jgi:hypothetical protein